MNKLSCSIGKQLFRPGSETKVASESVHWSRTTAAVGADRRTEPSVRAIVEKSTDFIVESGSGGMREER
jgi:hypothetical protein